MADERDLARLARDRAMQRAYRRQDDSRWVVSLISAGRFQVKQDGGETHQVFASTCDEALTTVLDRS